MELNIGIETSLFGGPPDLGDFIKKAKGQIGFMDTFALPLFDGVTEILPDMAFAANSIRQNKFIWQKLIDYQEHVAAHKEQECDTPRCRSPVETAKAYREKLESEGSASMFYTVHSGSGSPSLASSQERKPMDGSLDMETDTRAAANTSASSRTELPRRASDGFEDGQQLDQEANANCPTSSPKLNERQNGSRRGRCHRQFQRSSGRSSVPAASNRAIDTQNGVRTQSTSTYTNNTLMTPLSSTTQASSLMSAGSSVDEKDYARAYDGHAGDVGSGSYASSLGDAPLYGGGAAGSRSEPVTALPRPDDADNTHNFELGQSADKPGFMSSLLDKRFGSSHSHNPVSLKSLHSAPAFSNGSSGPTSHPRGPLLDVTASSASSNSANTSSSAEANPRTIPRRRSRLRLAFWRRNKQSPTSNPSPYNFTPDTGS